MNSQQTHINNERVENQSETQLIDETTIQNQNIQTAIKHTNVAGKRKTEKVFDTHNNCACKLKCYENIDILVQKSIFDHYHRLANWSQKTRFLRSIVERKRVKEQLSPKMNLKKREYTSKFFLIDDNNKRQQVCSLFIPKVLQIARSTVFRATQSKDKNPTAIEKRGKYPTNKTGVRKFFFMKSFIEKKPCIRLSSLWRKIFTSTSK